ncbi:MAG: alpha/beta hydrolase [Clostridiales bacterium]|nr:alpha/beta hydrolase [Clostridiales bacterium]
MLVLIVVLLIVLIVLFAQFGSNYYTQVRVMRRFFRNKGVAPEDHRRKVSKIADIDYHSVLSGGQLDLYVHNDAAGAQPLLVWVHGGGYVGSDKSCAEPWAYGIAAEKKAAVASINYCLAPEQHYPVPLLQLDEALRFLTNAKERLGLDTDRIFLAGDSAGAQIVSQYAAVVCNTRLQAEMKFRPCLGRDRLKGVLLCCGFYNMDTVFKSRFPAIKTFLWAYTNAKNIRKFARKDEMSAVKNLEEGYCDVYLTCGDADPFIGQAREMAAALAEANVPADVYLPCVAGKKLGHEYQFAVGTTEANVALAKAMEFIEKRV